MNQNQKYYTPTGTVVEKVGNLLFQWCADHGEPCIGDVVFVEMESEEEILREGIEFATVKFDHGELKVASVLDSDNSEFNENMFGIEYEHVEGETVGDWLTKTTVDDDFDLDGLMSREEYLAHVANQG